MRHRRRVTMPVSNISSCPSRNGILRPSSAFSLGCHPRRSVCYACGVNLTAALIWTTTYHFWMDTESYKWHSRKGLGICDLRPVLNLVGPSCPVCSLAGDLDRNLPFLNGHWCWSERLLSGPNPALKRCVQSSKYGVWMFIPPVFGGTVERIVPPSCPVDI